MKAVILARVSSKEQEHGHSIDAQLMRLREYCKRKELEIIGEYSITESSTRGERKKFKEMLAFCKRQKQQLALVVDAVDRIQRSFKESVTLDELIRKEVVELHFLRENMVINQNSRSTDILRWDFAVMGAKSYVLNLSDNVNRSFDKKKHDGTIFGTAPIGYLNVRDCNDKADAVLDPQRAFLVKKIFEEYATGLYSIKELRAKTVEWGLKNKTKSDTYLSQSQVDSILKNPFYFGVMRVKGNLYPHIYKPLITRELFKRCETVRQGRTKVYSKETATEFIFKGLIKCKNCGCVVTPELKKEKYVYLRPNPKDGCNCKQISETYALKVVSEVLERMIIPPAIAKSMKDSLKKSLDAKKVFYNDSIKMLRSQAKTAQTRLDNLLTVRIDGSITKDEYDKRRNQLVEEKYDIESKIAKHNDADEDFTITVEYILDIASRTYELFKSSGIDKKRRILNLVFPNFFLNGSKLEYTIRSPFNMLVNRASYPIKLPLVDGIRTKYFSEVLEFHVLIPILKELIS